MRNMHLLVIISGEIILCKYTFMRLKSRVRGGGCIGPENGEGK